MSFTTVTLSKPFLTGTSTPGIGGLPAKSRAFEIELAHFFHAPDAVSLGWFLPLGPRSHPGQASVACSPDLSVTPAINRPSSDAVFAHVHVKCSGNFAPTPPWDAAEGVLLRVPPAPVQGAAIACVWAAAAARGGG